MTGVDTSIGIQLGGRIRGFFEYNDPCRTRGTLNFYRWIILELLTITSIEYGMNNKSLGT